MKIDSHQHFWRYDPVRDSWINDSMAVLKKDFFPQDLGPELKANGIDGCIAVQAGQSEKETLFLLDLAAKNPFVRGVVGWVDLCDPKIGERLEFFSDQDQLCGFRHIVQAEPDERFMLQKSFLRGIGCLGEFGYTYDVLIYTHQFPAAIDAGLAYVTEDRKQLGLILADDVRKNVTLASLDQVAPRWRPPGCRPTGSQLSYLIIETSDVAGETSASTPRSARGQV